MTVHDFNEQLEYSHGRSDQPYWQEIYRQAFPDMRHMLDLRHARRRNQAVKER